MTTLKQFKTDNNVLFLTIKSIKGLPILIDDSYYKIILDSLNHCRRNKNWIIYAYTILINHIHIVLKVKKPFLVSKTINEFKSYTAHNILNKLKVDNQFSLLKNLQYAAIHNKDRDNKIWRRSCWPETIGSVKFLLQKAHYTDYNALKHGVVDNIEQYPYTSFHNHYCDHEVLLKIDEIGEQL